MGIDVFSQRSATDSDQKMNQEMAMSLDSLRFGNKFRPKRK
jgi:hypothetical protein